MRETIKFVAFGDLHFGFNKKIDSSGKLRVTPVHEAGAFRAMLHFIKDFKPNKILLMGDQFDMRPVCRHELDRPKLLEGQRLKEAYDKGKSFFIDPLVALRWKPELHWVTGNHEAWAEQLADKFPGIDGLTEPFNYLKLADKGFIYHPQGAIIKLGKLAFAHGDTIVRGAGKFAAARAVERFGNSIRCWHFHTFQVHTKETLKNSAFQTGVCVPSLCSRGPSYDLSPANSWVNGFNWGYIETNGNFHDYVTIIWKNKFSVPGFGHYDGRKPL